MTADAGRFITLEGGEGAGKSTQIEALARHLEARACPVVLTREPGGSEGAEAIRDLLLSGGADRWSPHSELLLLAAARRDHVERLIRPALARGDWVLCDRFADSTRAYQGAAMGLGEEAVETAIRLATDGLEPDLTFILDIESAVGLARAHARPDTQTRYERHDAAFHDRVRKGFLAVAAKAPARCIVVDAGQAASAVSQQLIYHLETRFFKLAP